MKKTILFALLIATPIGVRTETVNNSGTSAADSLAIPFFLLDSAGYFMPQLSADDSVLFFASYPSGAVAFRDTLPGNASQITEASAYGAYTYTLKMAVADIDGVGKDGVYGYQLFIKDISLQIVTPHSGFFQVYQTDDPNVLWDMIDDSVNVRGLADGTITSSVMAANSIGADQLAASAAIEIADTVLHDSASFQGSDSAQTARAIWNTPGANHTISGTFGKYLDSEISGISSGGGAYSFSIVAYDSSISQVIPSVSIAVRNIAQSALIGVGRTASDGETSFNLDADSFLIVASATGYIFDPFDTLIVTCSGVDTIQGCSFDPGTPASPVLCRVFGYLYNISGSAEENATITASLPAGVSRVSSVLISPYQVSAQSNAFGYFYLDLIPTDSLSPSEVLYEFTITTDDGALLRQRLEVPTVTSWQMTW